MKHVNVLALGVFDLFHIGHLRYLQYARQQGGHLTVAVCTDAICHALKDKWPVIPEAQRWEIIAGLDCVDRTRLLPCPVEHTCETAQWMSQWGIDHVIVGNDWESSEKWNRLIPVLAESGIVVSFAPITAGVSSSGIMQYIQQRDKETPSLFSAV